MRSTTFRALMTTAVLLTAGVDLGATAAQAAPADPCSGGVQTRNELTASWTGLDGTTLVPGGAAQQSTAVFRNTTGRDVRDFRTSFQIAPADAPTELMADAFTIELKLPSADWQPANFGTGNSQSIIDTGSYQLAAGEAVTVGIRVAATGHALVGTYGGTESGGSALLSDGTGSFIDYSASPTPTSPAASSAASPSPSAPASAPASAVAAVASAPTATSTGTATCTQFVGYSAASFVVADSAAAAASVTPSGPAAAASPPRTATSGAQAQALTDSDGISAFTAIGAAVLTGGAGLLFLLRRRKAPQR
ncbi:LPXTG cell wall anchor domain-containing protein [Kitasatospora sp. NPDC006697]|uniref:LPXTG cell wall anchor domain-containing protein n=1 Tax=Kitasatospora sp. NPDC006697 TaxID=3364020 RepID=UPI0036915941